MNKGNKLSFIGANVTTGVVASALCFLILKYVSITGDDLSEFLSDGGSLLPFIVLSIFISMIFGLIIGLLFYKFSKNN